MSFSLFGDRPLVQQKLIDNTRTRIDKRMQKVKSARAEYRKIWEDNFGPIPRDDDGYSYEIHHIDGNAYNCDVTNLECLCPNCHSLTPTWRKSKNAKKLICESLAPMVEWQTR